MPLTGPFYWNKTAGTFPMQNGQPVLITQEEFEACCCAVCKCVEECIEGFGFEIQGAADVPEDSISTCQDDLEFVYYTATLWYTNYEEDNEWEWEVVVELSCEAVGDKYKWTMTGRIDEGRGWEDIGGEYREIEWEGIAEWETDCAEDGLPPDGIVEWTTITLIGDCEALQTPDFHCLPIVEIRRDF